MSNVNIVSTVDLIHVTELLQDESAITGYVKCDCGFKMPILPAHTTWRKVQCVCDRVWYVKPSGRKFELPPRQVEY